MNAETVLVIINALSKKERARLMEMLSLGYNKPKPMKLSLKAKHTQRIEEMKEDFKARCRRAAERRAKSTD